MISDILEQGTLVQNRTGVDTISIFGYQTRFDLRKGFPAVTTKRLAWKAVVGELLWFLEGSTDERRLAEITYENTRIALKDKKTIWTANADAQGVDLGYMNFWGGKELGPIYGFQWRNFNNDGFDQIHDIIYQLKRTPESRRIILTAWNPLDIPGMALPPCHVLCQFRVLDDHLHAVLYQRSCDAFLGAPFNIASYALLLELISSIVNIPAGELIYSIGDAHIYSNHIDACREQISREPKSPPVLITPKVSDLSLDTVKSLRVSEFVLENYDPWPSIKGEMAV
jgi:thymidylate synthase